MVQNSVLCVECGVTPSDCTCRQCKDKLCSPCFDKLHSSGVTLRKHEKVRIDDTNKDFISEEAICKAHPGNICEYFCDNCSKYICETCVRTDHLKHSCANVFEKNKEFVPAFTEALNEAGTVLKVLLSTKKKLENTEIKSNDKEFVNIEKQVTAHFNQLHGLLQIEEEKVMKEIKNAQGQTCNSITNMMNDVDTTIKDVEALVTLSKAALDESNLSSFPICGMLEQLKSVAAMPCYLIKNDSQESTKMEFIKDPSINQTIKEHWNLIIPKKKTYELRPKFELPDGINIENLEKPIDPTKKQEHDDVFESVEKVLSKTMNSIYSKLPPPEVKPKTTSYQEVLRRNRMLLQNKTSDILSVTSSESDIESICSITPLIEGTTEVVTWCHFISPNNFYVQRKQTKDLIEKLSEHFLKKANIKRQPPENIEQGKMYLVLFDTDKKWYRGTVVKKKQHNCYEVFYVDYGNTETVHISNIREIPQNYTNIPGQALHCVLYGCVSIEEHWSEEALKLITSMSIAVDFSMYIEKIKSSPGLPNTYEVHLRSVDDTILSVADVLIYLGYAQLAEKMTTEESMYKSLFSNIDTKMKTYFTDVGITNGETFDAQITHINTPTNFYVQKINDGGQQMIQLMKDLKQTYSSLGPKDLLVLSPVAGLPVAAKFKDGEWYRGVVLQVARARYVQIQYVDFGNIECVSWTDIRTLHPKFLRKNIQGIKCALSDINPKHKKGWSVPAKKAFENMARKKTLFRVYVEKVEPSQISIVLYEVQQTKDICFNGLLVREGHAISVGPSSITAEYPHKIVNEMEEDCASIITTMSNSQNQKDSLGSSKYSNFDGLDSMLSDSKMDKDVISLKDSSSMLNVEGHSEKASRIKVKVLKVVTPGEIYVTFSDIYKKVLEQSTIMTNYYNSTEEEVKSWNAGDLCAVLRLKDNKWHRGLIKGVSSNRYKVFIKDIVDIVEVDKSGLRSLNLEFMGLMDGSVKCHLCGIIPPSGSKTWPHYAIDHLKLWATDPASDYFIYHMGNVVEDSLPVQLLKKKIVTGGALEPATEEWDDLSSMLIEVGCVLPDVKSQHYLDKKNNYEVSPNRNVIHWLQHSYEIAAQAPFVSDLEKDIASEKTALDARSVKGDPFNITDWKPAEPFKQLDFIAIPSFVDFQCAIYLQDIACQSTLALIQRALNTLFLGSAPKPHDLVWSKGQLCIAFYKVDDRWCRAKVLKVLPEHIEVFFVDYGNTEFLQPEDLRKQIILDQIPIQCHRCVVEGMIPVSADGTWPVKVLDFVHALVVTQECRVILKLPSSTDDFYTIKSLTLPSSQSLLDVLVSMHFATYIINCDELGKNRNDEEEELIPEPEPNDYLSIVFNKSKQKCAIKPQISDVLLPDNCSDITNLTLIVPETNLYPIIDWSDLDELKKQDLKPTLSYKDLILPDSVVELSVEITTVINGNSLKVTIIECEDPEVMAQIYEFHVLDDLIQNEGENMPPLIVPTKGLPCISRFSEDNSWYRAVITDVDCKQDCVTVYYVDYGNVETVPISRLREIKEEWTKVPILCLQVTLHNVCHGPDYDQASFQNLMSSCLSKPPYTMTIEDRQPLQVELYNSSGEIAYQYLINMGILSKLQD